MASYVNTGPLRVNLDKTQCEHVGSAFGRIAIKLPLWLAPLSVTTEPRFKLLHGNQIMPDELTDQNGSPSAKAAEQAAWYAKRR